LWPERPEREQYEHGSEDELAPVRAWRADADRETDRSGHEEHDCKAPFLEHGRTDRRFLER